MGFMINNKQNTMYRRNDPGGQDKFFNLAGLPVDKKTYKYQYIVK